MAFGMESAHTYGCAAWKRQMHVDDEEPPEGHQKTIPKEADQEYDRKELLQAWFPQSTG